MTIQYEMNSLHIEIVIFSLFCLICCKMFKDEYIIILHEEKYFPVFTDIDHLRKWKPELKKGEFIYLMDKQDVLDFLNNNEKVAAAVANPMEDDLLLYRMQLQNMITIGRDAQ